MSPLRRIAELPLLTLLGVAIGGLLAIIGAALSFGSLGQLPRPLMPLAFSPLPAMVGAWLDWARLWNPTRKVLVSSAVLMLGTVCLSALTAVMAGGAVEAMGVPLVVATLALIALVARPLRLARWAGWRTLEGRVRRDESQRVVVETSVGVVDLGRDAAALGSHREIDLSIGRPLAVVARLRETQEEGDPFRSERRHFASRVLAVATSREGIQRRSSSRALAWGGYLIGLALFATAFSAAIAYAPAPEPAVLACDA
ncbi:MAG: hypothetical protein AB8I08_11125 [Sandaracinaceae bacterium]